MFMNLTEHTQYGHCIACKLSGTEGTYLCTSTPWSHPHSLDTTVHEEIIMFPSSIIH